MSSVWRAIMTLVTVGVCSFLLGKAYARPPEIVTGPHVAPILTNRQPFMVPEGCSNLALFKKVVANTNNLAADLGRITDGKKNCDEENQVVLTKRVRWIQIDLERPSELFVIVIWHDFSGFDVCKGVVVQAADDPDFTQNLRTLFNNDYDDLNGLGAGTDLEYHESNLGALIDTHGIHCRYLRFYCRGTRAPERGNGHSFSTYTEIEAWGLPVDTQKPVGGTNAVPQKLVPLPLKIPNPPFM